MLNIYTSFECKTCRKEFVILTEDLESESKKGRYIACPFCCSKRLRKESTTDNLKQCMSERSYRRINGRIRQK